MELNSVASAFGPIIAALVFATAGLCLLFLFVNRVLLHMVDSSIKLQLILLSSVASVVGPGIVGLRVGLSSWIILPIAILMMISIGEVRRAVMRKRYSGTRPVTSEGRDLPWTQFITTMDLAVDTYEVSCEDWPGERLRVGHASDLHVDGKLPPEYYVAVMEQVSRQRPDLIFLTGDFVTMVEFADRLPQILKHAEARLGAFAVLGNHDHWAGRGAVLRELRSAGVRVLDNETERIDFGDRVSIELHGCGFSRKRPSMCELRSNAGQLNLALTHSPDNIFSLSEAPIHAVFAGHYHAGQVRLPYLGSILVPSVYGRLFDHGHFVINQTHLFVTSGIGASPPIRTYCQPDVIIVDFVGTGLERSYANGRLT